MGEQPAVEKTLWFKFDLVELQKTFCNDMLLPIDRGKAQDS